ncbi:MAG: phosphoglycerate dehydrogenase, partial [Chloroflexota bacterium]|nr:phosphoglycerate dehydrogenase [Chloroflexota bacterium]
MTTPMQREPTPISLGSPNGADEPAPRIAIDLDGVLTENPAPLAHAANARFGLSLPERAFVDSAGLNVALEVREWVYSEDGPAYDLQPAPGAQEFLQDAIRLFGEGNALIITARPEGSAAMTIAWLKRYGFPVCNVIFADDKMTVARRQGCGFAVEDSERHARNYAAGGITCFLLDHDHHASVADEPAIRAVDNFTTIVAILRDLRDDEGRRRHVAGLLPPLEAALVERPRIVVSDAIHPLAREEFARHAELVDVDGTDEPALLATLVDADALVIRSETLVTETVLAAAPKLKVLARAGAGVDNIDIAAATRAGVLVLNAPGANAVSAGEHTIALLLAITRQIPYANTSTHQGGWARKQIRPVDLR